MNLQNEIQQIEEAEKGCEVKKALAGALEKVEREFNRTEEKMSKGISDKVAELEARISDIEKKEILRQQMELLAERSKNCKDEHLFLISKSMLDISIYLDSSSSE